MTKSYNVKVEDLVELATDSVRGWTSTGDVSADATSRNTEAILLVGAAICERLERIAKGDPHDPSGESEEIS